MYLIKKLKETSLSVVPIILIVLILHMTIIPLGWKLVGEFALGGVLIAVGLSFFLVGTEIGIIPTGQRIGSALLGKRNLTLLLSAGLIIGFVVTIAEPGVQVLTNQIALVAPQIDKTTLLLSIALGVGIFVLYGFLRIVLQLSYKRSLFVWYAIVALCAIIADSSALGIAFDAGGATTGPMTVPFIIALGVGIAAVRKSDTQDEDSFGFVGLASIGPILAVLLATLLMRGDSGNLASSHGMLDATGENQSRIWIESLVEVFWTMLPLIILYLFAQVLLLHQTTWQLIRMFEGFIYAALGLTLFFVGVNWAFLPIGAQVGMLVASSNYLWILIPLGLILGAVVVLAEPTVWILSEQIEHITGGSVKKGAIILSLSIGVAFAVALAMVRTMFGFHIGYIILPGYLIALLLTIKTPSMFVSIAFDSGGVASGPMSGTFLLAFSLGTASSFGGDPLNSAFGIIALIAMGPLITIQILGIFYARKIAASKQRIP